MLKPARLFNLIIFLSLSLFLPSWLQAAENVEFKKQETGLYRDVFDQNIYYEATNLLRFDRLYRKIFNKKQESLNVNVYDEVPDSSFFTNRHARKRLNTEELTKGYQETSGPDLSGDLTVISGKVEGLHPGFFVKDAKGDKYLIKFDSMENFELATAGEIITSRFIYAIGYNVPQYTIAIFPPEKLKAAADALAYDDTGFRKPLTDKKLSDFLMFLPMDANGNLRASVSKILDGENKGNFSFTGRRKNDPDDLVNHIRRREIRSLQIFGSWLNNYDIRESNTLDILKDGKLTHYLIDFNGSLGSGTGDSKPPMFSHEYMMDYGESIKAYLGLGFWEKPWQKRWEEKDKNENQSPSVGYIDNRFFQANKYKTQLPHYAFKDVTAADAFWASKIIKSFSDEDIQAMVKAGQYTQNEDSDYLTKILIERRDLIAKHWFEKVSPLDQFELQNGVLTFKDLSVENQFVPKDGNSYIVVFYDGKKEIGSTKVSENSVPLSEWTSKVNPLRLEIRALRNGSTKANPPVTMTIDANAIASISRKD